MIACQSSGVIKNGYMRCDLSYQGYQGICMNEGRCRDGGGGTG